MMNKYLYFTVGGFGTALSAYASIGGAIALFPGIGYTSGLIAGALSLYQLFVPLTITTAKYAHKIVLAFVLMLVLPLTWTATYGLLSSGYLSQGYDLSVLQGEQLVIEAEMERNQRLVDGYQQELEILDAAMAEFIELGYITRGTESQAADRERIREGLDRAMEGLSDAQVRYAENRAAQQQAASISGPITFVAQAINADTDKLASLFMLFMTLALDIGAIAFLAVASMIQIQKKPAKKKGFETPLHAETIWINNGKKTRRLPKGQEMPKGWQKGRKITKGKVNG